MKVLTLNWTLFNMEVLLATAAARAAEGGAEREDLAEPAEEEEGGEGEAERQEGQIIGEGAEGGPGRSSCETGGPGTTATPGSSGERQHGRRTLRVTRWVDGSGSAGRPGQWLSELDA